jgi:hypothetical protein
MFVSWWHSGDACFEASGLKWTAKGRVDGLKIKAFLGAFLVLGFILAIGEQGLAAGL